MYDSQDLRTQLQQERDSVRHITLQKDIEFKELRVKMEKTVRRYMFCLEKPIDVPSSLRIILKLANH